MYWNTWKPIKVDTKFRVRYRYDEGRLTDLMRTLTDLELISECEGGYIVPFLDALMDERRDWSDKCSEWGKMSAEGKGRSTKKKEESREKIVESRKKKEYTPQFSELWNIYGLKGSKSIAFKRWNSLTEEEKDAAAQAIPDYLLETPDPQYRKNFEGFLNQKLFEGVLERKAGGCLNIPSSESEQSGISEHDRREFEKWDKADADTTAQRAHDEENFRRYQAGEDLI